MQQQQQHSTSSTMMQLGWTSSASSQSSKKTISFLKTSQFFVHQIPDFQPPTKRLTDLKRVKAIPNDIQLPGSHDGTVASSTSAINSRGTEKKTKPGGLRTAKWIVEMHRKKGAVKCSTSGKVKLPVWSTSKALKRDLG